jgi:Tol biopolymer transport system component
VRFDGWKGGKVGPSRDQVSVLALKQSDFKLEAVSPRLKQQLVHPQRDSMLQGLQFSPDGKRLVAGGYPDGVVAVWEVASGKQLTAIETGSPYFWQYFFVSPDWKAVYVPRSTVKTQPVEQDGKRLTRWKHDGDVRACDLETGRLLRTYRHEPPRGTSEMQLFKDGTRFITFDDLSGTYEHTSERAISIWETQTGQYRSLAAKHYQFGLLAPDGQSLALDTVDDDGYAQAIRLFDTRTLGENWSIAIKDKYVWLTLAAFSPDARLLVARYRVFAERKKWDRSESSFKWYDAATGREVASFAGRLRDGLFGCRFSPDGQTLAAVIWQAERAQLMLFHVPHRQLVKTIPLGEKTKGKDLVAISPTFSPDGKWLAVITQEVPETRGGKLDARDAAQARIQLINVAAGEIRETLIAPQGLPRSACFSPDGRTLATGGLGKVLLWDLSSRQ